jgi:ABC-type lipoprotein export system ATPase subunit
MISRKPPTISAGDVLLFEVNNQHHNQSQLKDFLHFLKFCGKRGALKFNHLEEKATLIKALSLKENILLDTGLKSEGKFDIVKTLDSRGHSYLAEMAKGVENFDLLPNEVDIETRKITSLIKAITLKSDYLLLEKPEKYLSKKNTDLFLSALFQTMTQSGQILMLTSENRNLWLSHVTKVVTRSDNGRFTLDAILSQNEIVNHGHLEFSNNVESIKKAA